MSIRIGVVLYYVIFCFLMFKLRFGCFIIVGVYSIVGVTCIRIEMMIMGVLLLVIITDYYYLLLLIISYY